MHGTQNIKIISVICSRFEDDVEIRRSNLIVRRECVCFGTISVSKYIGKNIKFRAVDMSGQVRLQRSERARM
jgi:hypothetical protein